MSTTLAPTLAVVIPVYNGAERLAAVLAGLVRQSVDRDRFEVVVADDGSEEDIAAVVRGFESSLRIRYVRQDHDGFGAGRARNLGAAVVETDVLAFVDADCVPASEFVERHLWWHERSRGVVVVGSRYHVDAGAVTADLISDDAVDLGKLARRIPEDGAPDDWRAVFYQRNRKLKTGDTAFRAVVSSNFSVDADAFRRVGGFSDRFRSWGGEDTELGWRLWNDGVVIAPANDAIVYHLVDAEDDRRWRDDARTDNGLLIADLIPNRFYRKSPSWLYSTPRVSWLAAVSTPEETRDMWRNATRSTYEDSELIVVGPADAIRPVGLLSDNPRARAFADFDLENAVEATSGEFVVIIDGRMTPHRRVVEHAVSRFDDAPRAGIVRGAYDIADLGVFGSLDDLRAVDRTAGRLGLPLFAVVRRRELMKDVRAGALNWDAALSRSKTELLLNDTVTGSQADLDVEVTPGRPGLGDMKSARSEEIARTVVRRVRRESRDSE